ncbi:MAG: HAMP domain-containing sensor histidine kinase [Bacteroidia bacterium]|nr:HAMP domain-containing histidine kinase [Bacteroidia bacterium]MDW8159688.1 HAMP domain-containing sensor histidine kinase [Bacteroidia bacterium]
MKIFLGRFPYLGVLFVVAILMITASLWYSNALVQRLAQKEERLVAFWADAYEYIFNNSNAEATFLVSQLILQKPPIISVPAIAIDQDGKIAAQNIPMAQNKDSKSQEKILARELRKMQQNAFPPITVELGQGKFLKVYYRETDELIQLRYYPFLNLIMMLFLASILFANFYIAQKNLQNKVWVGLARETAHQLGTPISALIAWIELLHQKASTPEDFMIVNELKKDIQHLETVAHRFSKIGSTPELSPNNLIPILNQSIAYLRNRITRSGNVVINLRNELPADLEVPISPELIQWVIENLLKNAMDALADRPGKIELHAFLKKNFVILDVSDTGKGIAPKDIARVFQPGFTTKKRGWGLGLSLCKRVITQYHKGKIYVYKTELEVGTTFRIILPLYPQKNRFLRFWEMLKIQKLDP